MPDKNGNMLLASGRQYGFDSPAINRDFDHDFFSNDFWPHYFLWSVERTWELG